MATVAPTAHRAWYISQRWQQFEGEVRANLLRIAAIGVFYLLHLWHYLGSQGKLPNWGLLELDKGVVVDRKFHLLATLLALSWAAAAAAVHLCLRNRVFPRWISTASTAVDLVMLTSVLCISTGPRSPLVVGYFLIIVLSALRFSLPLVRFTAIGAGIGYLCVLGLAKWPERFGRDPLLDIRVPRYQELVVLAAIALCGVFTGQIIRRARQMAEDLRALLVHDLAAMSTSIETSTIDEGRCSQCGAALRTPAARCWLCGANLSSSARPPHDPPPSKPARDFSYSLSTLMLMTTLVAVGSALVATLPGLGIPLCVLLAPVLVRTAMVVRRREEAGMHVSTAEKVGLGIASLVVSSVILAVVGVAAVGTFCFVCLSAGRDRAIPVAILAAAVVMIPTCVLLFRWVRSRYRRDIHRD